MHIFLQSVCLTGLVHAVQAESRVVCFVFRQPMFGAELDGPWKTHRGGSPGDVHRLAVTDCRQSVNE